MLSYEEIKIIPCKVLNTFPENEISDAINTVIDYYYASGFPYYSKTSSKVDREYKNLIEFDINRLELEDNVLQQAMLGLSSANAFHPEMWEVQCKNSKTPMQIYSDRQLFFIALRKRVKYSDTCLVDFNIRKSLKAFGVQAVSNFRPTIAKWIYEKYCPKGGKVLDPCAGYGGRLMGAMASHIGSYLGVDPNKVTQQGNKEFRDKLRILGSKVSAKLITMPFEDYVPDTDYDLVFTSPPYFDIEKYSTDDFQSYKRYPKKDLWVNEFLKVLITNSYNSVKDGGYVILNVGGDIVEETCEIGSSLMGSPDTYHMRLSKFLGKGDKGKVSHKTEPIFVWKK